VKVLRVSHSAVVGAWRQRERELIRAGLDVRLISANVWDEGGARVRLDPGADNFVIGARTFGRHPNAFGFDPRPLWRALGERWDVIDIHEEPCSLAAAEVLLLRWLRRSRSPYTLYSAQNIEKRYPLPFRWFERWALRGAAGVSVCNVRAGQILRGKGLRTAAHFVPLGVDTSLFAPADHLPNVPVTVGYVGRLDDHKGVHVLLDAIERDDRFRLDLVGAGPAEPRLRARARELEIADRVTFHGHADASVLARRYTEFDILAVPSLPTASWLEQFCRVAVEAMAAGVPVVASQTGAILDVLGDAGELVEPGDPAALSDALARVVFDERCWSRLRDAGVRRARQFNWAAVADSQLGLYRQAMARAVPSAVPTAQPGIEVVVVAYGSPLLIKKALEPLAGEFAITVVDNSSSAETQSVVEAAGGRYLDAGRNRGFAAGANYALANLQRPDADVLLLNPDATISAFGVRLLHKALLADPSLGCVSPAQVDDEGKPSVVEWPFPSPARAWIEALGFGRLWWRSDFVIGSVLLLRREALDAIGGFDERFFLYAEETDWQRRARHAGYHAAVVPEVLAAHTGGATSSDSTRRDTHFHASLEKYIRKYSGGVGWLAFRVGVLAGSARSVILRGESRSAAKRRVRLYARGPVVVESRLDRMSS
jgi:glycosyltransferase involved in cell wall biosynthesis/GT2 family glycosyltransferase